MPNHFLSPPFSMSPDQAQAALVVAIEQAEENAKREGLPIPRDELIAAITSGADWWESVENTRALVTRYRQRPTYRNLTKE
jgi:hypothetical protein